MQERSQVLPFRNTQLKKQNRLTRFLLLQNIYVPDKLYKPVLIGYNLYSSTGQNARLTVANCDIQPIFDMKIHVIFIFVLALLSYVASRPSGGLLVSRYFSDIENLLLSYDTIKCLLLEITKFVFT